MTSPTRLSGTELINCAQANAKEGIVMATHQCGYDNDIDTFQRELIVALEQIGIKNKDFEDLLKTVKINPELGAEIAPETATEV